MSPVRFTIQRVEVTWTSAWRIGVAVTVCYAVLTVAIVVISLLFGGILAILGAG